MREVGKIDTKVRLSEMIDTYQNLIFTICYRMTGDYFAAQDLTQETFLAAYHHMGEISPEHEKGWLARTAHNRCIDYVRKVERSAVSVEPENLAEQENDGDDHADTGDDDDGDALHGEGEEQVAHQHGVALIIHALYQPKADELAHAQLSTNVFPALVSAHFFSRRSWLRKYCHIS